VSVSLLFPHAQSQSGNLTNQTSSMAGYDYFNSQFNNILRNTTATVSNLHIATAGGWVVYNVWQENDKGNNEIYLAASDNGGVTYDTVINLSDNTGNSTDPQIGTFGDGSQVYVVWADDTPGNSEIFLRNSTDAGKTFHPVENLSQDIGDSVQPQLVVDVTGKVIISWISVSDKGSEVGTDCRRC